MKTKIGLYSTSLILLLLITISGCKNDSTSSTSDDQKMFQVRKMKTPLWIRNATIYEVNLRQYTKEGTINAFRKHIPRLKRMGVTAVYFMPIYPIGITRRIGELGNPYSIADFTKVNPELGTFEDFSNLVRYMHDEGFHIILDWVANHTSWDHTWIMTQKDWYTYQNDTIVQALDPEGKETGWTDVAELNFDSKPMANTMIESMKFWMRSADVDGFRCAAADYVPNSFWNEVRPALESIKPVFMLAESEDNSNHFETCFQANYGGTLASILQDISDGKANASDLVNYVQQDRTKYPAGYYHANFTSNHDQNSFQGPIKERLGEAVEAMSVLAFTMDGVPLIYGGQEAGLDHQLAFFEKDEISWEATPLEMFYKKLLFLKKHNKALWNGDAGGLMEVVSDSPDIFAFSREMDGNRVVVLVNCTSKTAEAEISIPLFSLTDLFTNKDLATQAGATLKLNPWQYYVLANPSIELE